jgi:hypothetical protein
MSVHTHTCVSILCDGATCDRDKGWEEGAPHFDSESEALGYVLGEKGMGWTRLPDGRLLCRRCSEEADCAATGHQWFEWRRHPRDPGIEWRWCSHCGGAFEERFVEIGGQP